MEDLETLVRRVDEDRWLASRFAPAPVRRRLIAIYAVNYEIARTPETVREAALGDIRLEWWRSAIADVHEGRTPPAYPALAAYAAAQPLPREPMEAMIAARRADLEIAPFPSVAAFDDYLDATAGNVMRLAIAACGADPSAEYNARAVHFAAWLWGAVGLLRSEAHWRARGRSFLPQEGGSVEELRGRAEAVARELRALPKLDASVFPALGYAALATGYLKALRRGLADRPLIARQLNLVAAAASGQL